MATYTGKDARVEAGSNAAGSDAVGKVKTITLDGEVESIEDEYLGEPGFDVALGSEKYSASITLNDDPDDAGQANLSLGALVAITLYPQGNTSGKTKIVFSAYVTSDPLTLEKNTKVEKTLPLKVIGVPVKTTIA